MPSIGLSAQVIDSSAMSSGQQVAALQLGSSSKSKNTTGMANTSFASHLIVCSAQLQVSYKKKTGNNMAYVAVYPLVI